MSPEKEPQKPASDPSLGASQDSAATSETEIDIAILIVDFDQGYAQLLIDAPRRQCSSWDLHYARTPAVAFEMARQARYTAIVLNPGSREDDEPAKCVARVRARLENVPLVLLFGRENEQTVQLCHHQEIEAFFYKSELKIDLLIDALTAIIDARAPVPIRTKEFTPQYGPENTASDGLAQRRQSPRYLLSKPLLAVPILPGKRLDWKYRVEGFTSDVSRTGIGFECKAKKPLDSKTLLIGVENDRGCLNYAVADVRFKSAVGATTRVGAEFVRGEGDLLDAASLMPAFDSERLCFSTGLSDDVLKQWSSLGILRPTVLDWMQVCPSCHALPTYRTGCPQCGSAKLISSRFIHHFACAYVGPDERFARQGQIVCPKCHARKLVIGADYENLPGPFKCLECSWSDTLAEQIAQCLRCGKRYPARMSTVQELVGYYVDRLDPLALFTASE